MDTTMNYKCPCCGAALTWKSKKQVMACDYCDNTFTEEQLAEIAEVTAEDTKESEMNWGEYDESAQGAQMDNMKVHICQSCGGEIVGDENSAATECIYCGSPTIITKNISGVYEPDCVIPFKKDKKAAKAALQGFYKGKRLLPNAFASKNRIDNITGVYAPFWMFDCDADAHITYDATKVRMWSDSNYNYTETRHFMITREGKIGFEQIPVDGSEKLEDSYMDAIEPFDYKEMTKFTPTYLSGYFADRYDVDSKASIPRANERVKNSTEQTFAQSVKGYSTVVPRNTSVKVKNGKVQYAMFPVWMLSTKYEDKIYTFAMNGQTGKIVGELPVDKSKFYKYLFGITAAVFAAAQILVFLI